MKKRMILLLCILMLPGMACADSVQFGGASFDREARKIDLGETEVTDWDAFVRFLGKFSALEEVDMFATVIKPEQTDRLTETFPEIRFGWTLWLTKFHTVRTDAEAFSTLHGWCDAHRSEALEPLKYCTEMKALDLGHNNLTDLSFLLNMPHLRVLILAGNKNLGANIETLSELKELEYLELFGCGIRDLTPLTKLPNLMDLNLCNNKAPDWEPLKEMTWLKRLWVSNLWGIRMPKKDQEELTAALPDTEIVFKGDPTEYGWRDDPHYEIIYEMFHTGKYIPFAESAPAAEESGKN